MMPLTVSHILNFSLLKFSLRLTTVNWVDRHFISFISEEALEIQNKRNQSKIKGRFTGQNNLRQVVGI